VRPLSSRSLDSLDISFVKEGNFEKLLLATQGLRKLLTVFGVARGPNSTLVTKSLILTKSLPVHSALEKPLTDLTIGVETHKAGGDPEFPRVTVKGSRVIN